ncbi:MAG: hypothetical protein SWK76_07065 [Actinomycetota bacterium]|nr:hypothetical protein [Actinomycetota bacterium]
MYSSYGGASLKFKGTIIAPSLFKASSTSRKTLLLAIRSCEAVALFHPHLLQGMG